jgi:SAM-dependent methyltransferase
MTQAEIERLLAGLGAGNDAYRTPYYAEIARYLDQNRRTSEQRIAEFGAASNGVIRGLMNAFGYDDYTHLPYPKYDLLELSNVSRASFDVVILEQVLEHLPNPFRAAERLFRVLAPGGIAIVPTVLLYPMHYIDARDKQDFFRYTPLGLRAVFDAYDVQLATAYGSLPFVQHLSEHGWFEQGRSGGYGANTIDRAVEAGRFDMDDEDFGVTTLIIASRPERKRRWLRERFR